MTADIITGIKVVTYFAKSENLLLLSGLASTTSSRSSSPPS